MKIRCCLAYVTQECDYKEKMLFGSIWTRKWLKQPIQMPDYCFNLWAGKSIIPYDPREQNRKQNGKLEQSVLDFCVVCPIILSHITRMVINENKKYVLQITNKFEGEGRQLMLNMPQNT